MKHEIIEWAAQFPPPVATVLIAALPIAELRGAIPYAVTLGEMGPVPAYLYAVLGNCLPVLPILLTMSRVEKALRRYGPFDTFLSWLFARTRKRSRLVERYEAVGLVLFVAVPLPVTGAWTGALAAYLFRLPVRFAAPAIFLGVCIAGIVVSLAMQGIIRLW